MPFGWPMKMDPLFKPYMFPKPSAKVFLNAQKDVRGNGNPAPFNDPPPCRFGHISATSETNMVTTSLLHPCPNWMPTQEPLQKRLFACVFAVIGHFKAI